MSMKWHIKRTGIAVRAKDEKYERGVTFCGRSIHEHGMGHGTIGEGDVMDFSQVNSAPTYGMCDNCLWLMKAYRKKGWKP